MGDWDQILSGDKKIPLLTMALEMIGKTDVLLKDFYIFENIE